MHFSVLIKHDSKYLHFSTFSQHAAEETWGIAAHAHAKAEKVC
jgi:hypothetical protein